MKGILGKKLGMSRIFKEDGQMVPVTLIQAGPCPVVQVKSEATDGYQAVQLGYLPRKEKHTTKAQAGHFKRAGVNPTRVLCEFRNFPVGELKVGDMVKADIFTPGDRVDVRGITKGKGFAGVMKRHNFSGHKDSHGTHESFRGPGSISSNTDPARVFKGKRMAGRMGGAQQTARNLKLVRLEAEKNILWVKGAIPGPNGGIVEVRATKKS